MQRYKKFFFHASILDFFASEFFVVDVCTVVFRSWCDVVGIKRSKRIESPQQTHRKPAANASKARGKRTESPQQTYRILYPKRYYV
ncbi:MAG: hypothetical protein IJ527_09380 [Prevotella sp.]|nr:hypothetical protein [Prevotella sp.]